MDKIKESNVMSYHMGHALKEEAEKLKKQIDSGKTLNLEQLRQLHDVITTMSECAFYITARTQ